MAAKMEALSISPAGSHAYSDACLCESCQVKARVERALSVPDLHHCVALTHLWYSAICRADINPGAAHAALLILMADAEGFAALVEDQASGLDYSGLDGKTAN